MEFNTTEEKALAIKAAEKVVAESEGEAKVEAEKVLAETKEAELA